MTVKPLTARQHERQAANMHPYAAQQQSDLQLNQLAANTEQRVSAAAIQGNAASKQEGDKTEADLRHGSG